MSTNRAKVTLQEFTLRPLKHQPRPDQADVARVYFSSSALQDLGLKPGSPCYIHRANGESNGAEKRIGIAWAAEKTASLSKSQLQMYLTFKSACGFDLEDRLVVEPAGALRTANEVVLMQVQESGSLDLAQEEKNLWKAESESRLRAAKIVFSGMEVTDKINGIQRTFVVKVIGDEVGSAALMTMNHNTAVKIASNLQELAQFSPGRRPKLEISGIAGFDQALLELNSYFRHFHDVIPHYLRERKGIIIQGSSGTGKTHLLDHIERQSTWPISRITVNMKPSQLKDIFSAAIEKEPSIVLIDDLNDMISSEKGQHCPFGRALGEEMRRLTQDDEFTAARVAVIASSKTTSEGYLTSLGVFEERILLRVPDTSVRRQILEAVIKKRKVPIDTDVLTTIAERTHAYTGGDLRLLVNKACNIMDLRLQNSTAECKLIAGDLEKAKLKVRPAAMHDITLQPPRVKWEDIGGQESTKEALRFAVEVPLKYPHLYARLGLRPKKGLLLYGPPGCSKTLSAQAMATEAGLNFFAVKGAELLNMYVGESERAVREVFKRARDASPSIVFFDEIEAIGSKREGKNNGVNVLTTLLNEMDGIESLEGVIVLAATNKPEALDLALLRPGRFDDLLYVAPPDQSGREAILNVKLKNEACADDVDIPELARCTAGYTGAEIVSIHQKAGETAIKRVLAGVDTDVVLVMDDLLTAIPKVKQQVTLEMVEEYERWAMGKKS